MSNQIHILHVVGAMDRGGAEVMLMDIFRNISSDYKFDFLVNYKIKNGVPKGDLDEEIISKGATIKYIGTQWDIGVLSYVKQFKLICNSLNNPPIVHIHLNAKSGIIAVAAKLAGVKKVIVHSHADLKFRGSFVSRVASTLELKFQKILIALFGDQFWGCSKEANNSLFYPFIQNKDNTRVINNAVDVDEFTNLSKLEVASFKKKLHIQEDTLVLGNVGRIVRHKNVGFIIDVLHRLKSQHPNFVFVFAGRVQDEVYMTEIDAKIEKYNLKDHIRYIGLSDNMPLVFNTFDVFLGTALQEGFGLVAVEAQAAGAYSILYKGFPSLVNMKLNLTKFMPNFEEELWVNAILNSLSLDVIPTLKRRQNIIDLGFDSKSNAKNIQSYYKEMLS
jgi:glycosyltransferase EpsF